MKKTMKTKAPPAARQSDALSRVRQAATPTRVGQGNPDKMGALWLGKSQNGVSYMSGVLTIDGEEKRIVVFKNGFKEDARHPDYIVYASRPREADAPTRKAEAEDEIPF